MGRISRPSRMKIICTQRECSALFFSHVLRSRAQYAVLTKQLGVKKIHTAIGFSMGGQQVITLVRV